MEMIYANEKPDVQWHSSVNQYKGFLSVITRGGYTPIVFDQLDGISCETVISHPVIISFGDDIGYHFSDKECSYASDKFIYFDRAETQEVPLPKEFGGNGEFYIKFIRDNTFVNFDDDNSIGVHDVKKLRVGTNYALADKMLPVAE